MANNGISSQLLAAELMDPEPERALTSPQAQQSAMGKSMSARASGKL